MGVEKVDARRAARPRRLHHAAHAADRSDAQHPLGRESRQDQEGRAHHQLRARRADRRGGAQGGARFAAMSPAPRSTCSSTEPAKASPLFGTPNFISTPHLGASTDEAQVNVAIQVAEQMADYLMSGGVTNALNMPSLSAEEAPQAASPTWRWPNSSARWSASSQGDASRASRSRSRARPPSSTRSRSPARCWPG